MAKLDVYSISGQKVDTMELSDSVFNIEVNEHVMYEAVKNYLANQRQGTHSAKTRAEVRGGGRKPFKQKGTGRARQGTIRSPHMPGGGVAFAKKPRDYSYKLPKKIKRLALLSALSDKFQNEEMIIVQDFALEAPKTKEVVKSLYALNAAPKALIMTDVKDDTVLRAGRNIAKVNVSNVGEINVYDLLNCDSLVISVAAIKKLEEVYA